MKLKFTSISILFFFILVSFQVIAEIKLPVIFGDNMVLQQQTDAAIWGNATANKTVKVTTSWNDKSYSAKADSDGNWKLKVQTPTAGGPFSISISDGSTITLNNILIGEVWVCSGQSNMEMPMRGFNNQPVLGSNEAIALSNNENIRLFNVRRQKITTPQVNFEGEWEECIPGNVANFSAAAYYFGKMVQEALDVPVGLISSNWGGTRIEAWISEAGFKNFDSVELPAKDLENPNQNAPTVLFNGMINPMVGYSIKGAIWYQGEANRNEPAEYEKLMQGLIENWRDLWGVGEFPFYYCQIAPYDYGPGSLNSAFIRDAQRKAALNTPNTGMASLIDIGEKDIIHPANKKAAGERLAYWALAKTYSQDGIEYSGPELKEMTVEGQMVHLTFEHAKNGLTTFGNPLDGFIIAGDNKRFLPAKAWITRNGITLFNENISEPVAVRFAWEDFTVGELYNTEGLPASSFRTDDWEIK